MGHGQVVKWIKCYRISSEITVKGLTEMSCQVSSPMDILYHKTITYN